jgi:hypothetical protein
VVECDLAKVEVAGSNPVSRSKSLVLPFPSLAIAGVYVVRKLKMAAILIVGAVPKW